MEVKTRILERLRSDPGGMSKAELLGSIAGTSAPTVQRALKALESDGVIARDTSRNRWQLVDEAYHLSLDAPDNNDLQAVLIAEAMLGPLVDDDLQSRLRALAEQLDQRIRDRGPSLPPRRATAVEVSVTSATRFEPQVLTRLLAAVRRQTVLLEYTSPWTQERKRRLVEPWQLRLHDSAWYLRAFDRDAAEPRTFRLAHIHRVSHIPHAGPPRVPVPARQRIWGRDDPAFGIDHDRPDVARIIVAAPVSHWLRPILWSPAQKDRWLPGDRLERTVAYRSCREFARTVRAVADAVITIEPEELRNEVLAPISDALSDTPLSRPG